MPNIFPLFGGGRTLDFNDKPMQINEIIQILKNKLTSLESAKEIAFRDGLIEEYTRLGGEIEETKMSLSKLEEL